MHRKPGFTLIELLIVVAIIGLLISIILPSLSVARAQARQTTCGAQLYQVGVGIYNYWTEWNGRVPHVISPMTNSVFANQSVSDADADPFDREKWPLSLPNVLMPTHIGEEPRLFNCPAAINGWPRGGDGAFRYSYREAAANQPNGSVTATGSYEREAFGFMDGRVLWKFQMDLVADPKSAADYIKNAQQEAYARGTFVRDLIQMRSASNTEPVIGPHRNGAIQTLDRDLQVRLRSRETAEADLAPAGNGVQF